MLRRQPHVDEVACHGQSHELVYRQAPAVFREETLRSKARLEDLTGLPVRGYRAASYSITRKSLWALDVILDAGFEYDSSVFPIRHDVYGLPGAPLRPGRIAAPSGRTLVEFPLSVAEVLGLRLPVAGGGYFRLLPAAALCRDAGWPASREPQGTEPLRLLPAPMGGGSGAAAHRGAVKVALPALHEPRRL